MNDIILDENNDVLITNGDFTMEISDEQQQKLLLVSEKGSFKQYPSVGVGLFSYIENEDPSGMLSEIRRQFTGDGMTINKITYAEGGKLSIDASY